MARFAAISTAVLIALISGCVSSVNEDYFVQGDASDAQFKQDLAYCKQNWSDASATEVAIGGWGAYSPETRVALCMERKGYKMKTAWSCENGGQYDQSTGDCF